MKPFDQISQLSPLPIVDLQIKFIPEDGWMFPLSGTCQRHLEAGDKCRNYYESLSDENTPLGIHQCPFGFATIKFISGSNSMAVTGFIPFPRIGGTAEKILSKRHPNYKFAQEHVEKMILNLRKSRGYLQKVEDETIDNYSMALHEIRKLNRTVVQNAERICRRESPYEPENASQELVSIWKAAELMSRQFDVIEILANQVLVELPLNTTTQPYRIFHKCVKVYRTMGVKNRITLTSIPYNFAPIVKACDKTFPIIPTVLIENAIKYSLPSSEIKINFEKQETGCLATVTSESNQSRILDNSIFERGVRATSDRDGSGNGLYVAQLVAQQHKTKIEIRSEFIRHNTVRNTFSMLFKVI